MPLSIAPLNSTVKIVAVNGKNDIKIHLEALGLVKGEVIDILSLEGGNIILRLKDMRLALDRKTASNIEVEID